MYLQGLAALEDLTCDQAVVEYTGKVMLQEQYDKENIFFKRYVLCSNNSSVVCDQFKVT